jgi:uncharacterized protein YjbI with pentapeptide repeats
MPTHYFYFLQVDWQQNAAVYQPLEDALKAPLFLGRSSQEKRRLRYLAEVLREVDFPMMDELFGIREIYVPPLGAVISDVGGLPSSLEELAAHGNPQHREAPLVVDLGKELLRWIYVPEAREPVRLILGPSGSGKTSFLNALSAKLAGSQLFPEEDSPRAGVPLLQVSLADLPARQSLPGALNQVAVDHGLSRHFLDPEEGPHRLLLILDGVDQPASPEVGNNREAQRLFRELEELLDAWNQEEVRLQVLLSTSPNAQINLPENLRATRSCLWLLPLSMPPELRLGFHDDEGLLLEDKRGTWWKNFQEARGIKPEGLPPELHAREFQDLTQLPLQNYLTALAWHDSDEPLEDRRDANTIYHHLLRRVHQQYTRAAAARGLTGLEIPFFERVLQEIAVAQWRTNFSQGTLPERLLPEVLPTPVTRRLRQAGFAGPEHMELLFQNQLFRRDPSQTAPAFRLYPRAFGEYLVARRLRQLAGSTRRALEAEVLPEEDAPEEKALRLWGQTTGHTHVTPGIAELLVRELSALGADDVVALHVAVTRIFNFALREGIPVPGPTATAYQTREVVRQSRNAEEALLVLLNACALNTREISQVQWLDAHNARTWLHRLQSADDVPVPFAMKCLDYMDLRNCQLTGSDLIGASLRHSDLSGASLRGSNLAEADLSHALLREADLCVAGLAAAVLYNANLREADLRGAVLRAANLGEAILNNADIRGATFQGADLQNASLHGTDADAADFSHAELQGSSIDPASRPEEEELA